MPESLDFLREKKLKQDQLKKDVDWEKRKTWWISKIDGLYKEVKEWLGPLISDDIVKIEENKVVIYEERLGNYTVPSLKISVGSEWIDLVPIGTIILAALGRVDVVGEEGSVKIVLEHKGRRPQVKFYLGKEEIEKSKKESKPPKYDQMETEWIVPTEKGRKKYQVLTKEVFFDVLKMVMSE